MTRTRLSVTTLAALALCMLPGAPAVAGIADSPLPVLMAGATTLHLYSVPGVIGGAGGLGSFFSCTSTDTATMQVGVELFGPAGGAPINDPVATSLSVAPGATVIFGTSGAAGISISSSLGGGFSKGRAHPRHVEEGRMHGVPRGHWECAAHVDGFSHHHREDEAEGG